MNEPMTVHTGTASAVAKKLKEMGKPSVSETLEERDSEARCAGALGSACEPLRHAYSHEESLEVAKQWMRDNYGIARALPEESRDKYHEKLGLLVDFLHTLFPPNTEMRDTRHG